ncbi:polysaccharide deacetylase family protein [candidate division KSB1 bacterium]|nr:polysaccharide deacetylase family protein [candidate division KSB1 bacterium]
MKKNRWLLFVCLLSARMLAAQEIALTFDDAPIADGLYYTGVARTETLIAKLKNQNVPQVAFYCISSRADSAGRARLRRYAEAGHIIANHSHSHSRIQQLGAAGYVQDIFKADAILRELPGFKPWFRFPFLDEGRTLADRDDIRQALNERGYFIGYVTVDNYDWYFERLFQAALREKMQVDHEKLEQLYLEHLWQSLVFYDQMALAALGRSPKHVLLLHENDLAALFIDGLINFLRAKGWKIISPAEAYTDPIATTIPDVLLNNQGRVAAIAKAKGYAGRFSQASEDTEYLEKLFEQQQIFQMEKR